MSREPLSDDAARALAELPHAELAPLLAEARAVRDRAFGRVVTFSPKVFLPLTNLCRNRCTYCSFRRSPGQAGAWTMSPAEVTAFAAGGEAHGCAEALFCLGDTPETAFPSHGATLEGFGHRSTVAYLHASARVALAHGLLPHTNAGILSREEMAHLREVNVSLGLMLECVSERLSLRGMPHHRAPDKHPARRLAMIDEAGQLAIPFTTGILVGIGETRAERIESLLAIRALHRRHGHVQEVIVQSFRARPDIVMRDHPEPDDLEIAHAVAMARLVLDPDVSVQAPPNLSPAATESLLAAGINDFGGISPLTPDYINPRHPWPHLDALAKLCAREGYTLRPRMPIYDAYVDRRGYLDDALVAPVERVRARLRAVGDPSELAPSAARARRSDALRARA